LVHAGTARRQDGHVSRTARLQSGVGAMKIIALISIGPCGRRVIAIHLRHGGSA
jgi:hypothetical protein